MDWSTPIFLIFVGMISAILWLRNDIDTLPDATLKSSYDYIVGMYIKTVLWLHSMLIVLKINVMSCLIYR